ncbi:MAG: PHP domain-containing protein [Bacteroidales bacterium]|jgi:hypothetical protein|nr:PHP domain-containing protein [Bacteroidales bacterium]
MKTFRADLHIHTLLSPCGDLEMSPDVILAKAREKNLDLIGITDHNSTRQCRVIREMGADCGITVLTGAEVTTLEEAHCLVYFDTFCQLNDFQKFLDIHLPNLKNDVKKFGYQVYVDALNNIKGAEERLLINALDASIDEVEKEVHRLNGLFIPAHLDKQRFSIISQLGFLPPDLKVDALEISPFTSPDEWVSGHPEHKKYCLISGSDAHYPDQIGTRITGFIMNRVNFEEIRNALKGESNREVIIMN